MNSSSDLASAARVLQVESGALTALAEGLDQAFVQALDLLSAASGRVVVSGMGKSGHVARKIAATLASTGTPAQFVHPGEASHGDLGMIAGGDALIALSNSGNTPELNDIIAHSRRFSIPMIGITSRADSVLAEASDVALILPGAPEACPMGLAPTTSTTLMMALGDAIAVALLERQGFSKDRYRELHPGGALGKGLLRVLDLMHTGDEIPLCRPQTPMSEAALLLASKRKGCVGIVDDQGDLIGIVTDGDLGRHWGKEIFERQAGDIMTTDPKTILPQAFAAEALGLMNSQAITCLFVVEDTRPVGILHMHDCLRAGVV